MRERDFTAMRIRTAVCLRQGANERDGLPIPVPDVVK
jgi:hypothetical protein